MAHNFCNIWKDRKTCFRGGKGWWKASWRWHSGIKHTLYSFLGKYLLKGESSSVRWFSVGCVFLQVEISPIGLWLLVGQMLCGEDTCPYSHEEEDEGRGEWGPAFLCLWFFLREILLVCFTKATSWQAAQDWLHFSDYPPWTDPPLRSLSATGSRALLWARAHAPLTLLTALPDATHVRM